MRNFSRILCAISIASGLSIGVVANPMGDDFDIKGVITAVDDGQKTITLSGATGANLTIKILPYTELKGDDCGAFGRDVYGTFKDLTVGKFVKIEAVPYNYDAYGANNANAIDPKTGLPQNMQLAAKEVEWDCRPKAY